MLSFREKVKPKRSERKQQKEDVLKNLCNLFEGREREREFLMLFIVKYFQ